MTYTPSTAKWITNKARQSGDVQKILILKISTYTLDVIETKQYYISSVSEKEFYQHCSLNFLKW